MKTSGKDNGAAACPGHFPPGVLMPFRYSLFVILLSAAPITIDPIFSGLAWSLIFGL